ncbi:nitroreductase family deazaflavin-dependent oxidoreductase [Pedococcus sp. KACC 23699]|uniref:Nitroreductase family deazaflavin-dependent oxidoreductase n=1 Tax=Pedococcus sp. KACC 23699 TaxID=3149228 RepID=A0AAU7JQS7_9MICO
MTQPRTAPREGTQTTRYLDLWWSRRLIGVPLYLWRLGLGPLTGRVWMVVTTTGRSTGLPRHVAVYPHVVHGHTYLWCPYGGRSQWFRNLLADPVATVQWHGETTVVRAMPLADEAEAMEVVGALRHFAAAYFGKYLASQGLVDTDEDVRAHWRRLHLLRLEVTSGRGPAPLAADRAWLWAAAAGLACTLRSVVRRHPARRAAPRPEAGAPPGADRCHRDVAHSYRRAIRSWAVSPRRPTEMVPAIAARPNGAGPA